MTRTDHVESAPSVAELHKLLLKSEKFIKWNPAADEDKPFSISDLEQSEIMAEKYYTPDELSELWAVSTETIRSIFRNEPGVLKIGKPGTRNKRAYFTLRIPADVAERIHARLTA